MKETMKKIAGVLKMIFGYGIMICLFVGGLTFLGYVAALIIGGDAAAAICYFMHKQLMPVLIRVTTVLVLLGLAAMYMAGEVALTAGRGKAGTK